MGYERTSFAIEGAGEHGAAKYESKFPVIASQWLLKDFSVPSLNNSANPGHYSFPFSIPIPEWLPASTFYSDK